MKHLMEARQNGSEASSTCLKRNKGACIQTWHLCNSRMPSFIKKKKKKVFLGFFPYLYFSQVWQGWAGWASRWFVHE
jgi:hypothetical protein